MSNLFELIKKKCPICGQDTLVLELSTDGKKSGMVEAINDICIYCITTNCFYNKYIAKKVK